MDDGGDVMNTKKLWASKTFWVNVLAIIVVAVQTQTGFIIDIETQAAILAVVNLALRAITKTEIVWKK
jgi:hypothetical protein